MHDENATEQYTAASTYGDDIPLDLARAAHRGTSFVPDERGAQERAQYASTLASDLLQLEKLATTPALAATLAEEFARYRRGLRGRWIALLSAKSRCVSTMIAGPSGFNTRRHAKASGSADKRSRELVEYRAVALAAIRRKLQPHLAPVMAGDSDAQVRLAAKIAKLEKLQEQMKAINAAIRKHAKKGADAQVEAIVALGIVGEDAARKLLVPDFCGRIGFADYEIKNNGAELRRLKGRLGAVARDQATETTTTKGEHATIDDAPADNRVRLFFPGKPDATVRSSLKGAGFRWTPSLGCWQAYRNHRALSVAKAIAGVAS